VGRVDVALAAVLVGICAATIGRTLTGDEGVVVFAGETDRVGEGDVGGAGGSGRRVGRGVDPVAGACFLLGVEGGRGTNLDGADPAARVAVRRGVTALMRIGVTPSVERLDAVVLERLVAMPSRSTARVTLLDEGREAAKATSTGAVVARGLVAALLRVVTAREFVTCRTDCRVPVDFRRLCRSGWTRSTAATEYAPVYNPAPLTRAATLQRYVRGRTERADARPRHRTGSLALHAQPISKGVVARRTSTGGHCFHPLHFR